MMGMISPEGRAVAAEAVGEQYRAVRRQVSVTPLRNCLHHAELIRVQHSSLSLERDSGVPCSFCGIQNVKKYLEMHDGNVFWPDNHLCTA